MLELHEGFVAGRLAGASVAILPGKVTAICGPNGAGKSTLLAVLAGLLRPDAGQVLLDGSDLAALPPRDRARRIGYLPQHGELAWNLDVRTLAALGRLPHASGAAADARATDAALAALGLAELAQRPLATLSGGERARALLARVLAGEPQWILADEPLASLDLAHQAVLLGQFRALARAGKAVVLVLHDLAAAMNHADQVIVLNHGKIAAAGAPESALAAEIIAAVWGMRASWLGEGGRWALQLGPLADHAAR